jgi:hypothetical protein
VTAFGEAKDGSAFIEFNAVELANGLDYKPTRRCSIM